MRRGLLLEFIAEEFQKAGAPVLLVRDMAAVAEVEKVLDELAANNDPARAATQLAYLLPSLPLDTVAQRLGQPVADLFERLAGGRMRNRSVAQAAASRLVEDADPQIAAAGVAFLAAEAVGATTTQAKSDLRRLIEIPFRAAVGVIKTVLQRLIDALPPEPDAGEEVDQPRPVWVISISLDVVASTEAKSRMRALAADDAQLQELYAMFYTNFLAEEDRFYRGLLSRTRHTPPPLDWRKLFVVKGIGDEVWLLYEVPKDDLVALRNAMARVLEAALVLVSEVVPWAGGERVEEMDDWEQADQRHDSMDLPFKLYIDLVADGYELSSPRGKFVSGNLNDYLGLPGGSRFGADHVELANRLNAGYLEIAGRKMRHAWRTDFIGHEVDRFFRTTKACLPGVVTVGESLFAKLALVDHKLVAYPGLFQARTSYQPDPDRLADLRWSDPFLYMQTDLMPSDMKGIGYSYRTYHVTTRGRMFVLHNAVDAGVDADLERIFEPTLKLFSLELVNKLRTLQEEMNEAEGDGAPRSHGDGATTEGGKPAGA